MLQIFYSSIQWQINEENDLLLRYELHSELLRDVMMNPFRKITYIIGHRCRWKMTKLTLYFDLNKID